MTTNINSILFATNLSEDCRAALGVAVYSASYYKARLILLYVIPRDERREIQEHLESLLGKEKWEAIKKEDEENAREVLIGKVSHSQISHKILQRYFEKEEINLNNPDIDWQEVVTADSNVSSAIIDQARKYGCDMIVLGAGKGFFGETSVGSVIKGVLRRSNIPVLVVPSS